MEIAKTIIIQYSTRREDVGQRGKRKSAMNARAGRQVARPAPRLPLPATGDAPSSFFLEFNRRKVPRNWRRATGDGRWAVGGGREGGRVGVGQLFASNFPNQNCVRNNSQQMTLLSISWSNNWTNEWIQYGKGEGSSKNAPPFSTSPSPPPLTPPGPTFDSSFSSTVLFVCINIFFSYSVVVAWLQFNAEINECKR